jgi:hypothetical protein
MTYVEFFQDRQDVLYSVSKGRSAAAADVLKGPVDEPNDDSRRLSRDPGPLGAPGGWAYAWSSSKASSYISIFLPKEIAAAWAPETRCIPRQGSRVA